MSQGIPIKSPDSEEFMTVWNNETSKPLPTSIEEMLEQDKAEAYPV